MVMKKIELNWLKIIIFAIITGIYAGIMTLIPAAKDTSFQDISISFEWWILFGILIIMGSKSNKDSALKCFVFFLISQPLVYLVQIIAGKAGWEIFGYYKTWAIWTVLTLPMGYIGYYLKKNQWWGLLIMAPIWLLLGWHINNFLKETVSFFPNHFLSLIFCIATMFLYVFWLFKNKRERIIGSIFCSVIIAACAVFNFIQGPQAYHTTIFCNGEEAHFDNSSVIEMDEKYGTLEIVETDFGDSKDYCLDATFRKTGKTTLTIKNAEETYTFDLTIERNSVGAEKRQ